jgi:hypothetical protein
MKDESSHREVDQVQPESSQISSWRAMFGLEL